MNALMLMQVMSLLLLCILDFPTFLCPFPVDNKARALCLLV